ncbi:MAG: hypothetical protein PHX64_05000 [Candidatus Omnitrophica bacterium]|nr:hypothetical protein [Candidatus Omnitrophota bacterium]MDD5311090.1 hypothetical protein [Candidatus Omnitrophota bacterium]MDD5546414.1 hypothetical protein [Candidatus Omnitrophota bacterium]
MKRFAIAVVLLYGVILFVLTVPVFLAAFYPELTYDNAIEVIASLRYWVLFAVMLICQAALLGIPIETGSNRPIRKRSIIYSVIAISFVMTGLAVGIFAAITETVIKGPEGYSWLILGLNFSEAKEWLAKPPVQIYIISFIAVWFLWGAVFYRWSKKYDPRNFVERKCRLMFKGSVLELLVAVPTHIIARSRDYCCAGFSTFIGIALGISVMLLSFGPGVYFLFLDRWKKLHPQVHPQGEK